ncbi:hypothetical protein [uncultured Alistipes sp.]|uniref:hypothetical protein n=1 Tax=uncultured Alistipes sp. TaxID=538949 RepID=UPI0025D6D334|nr:hypothetical protein [uncultured Alistipes sp.]
MRNKYSAGPAGTAGQGVFAIDHAAPDWDRAEMSSVGHLASVDIPVQTRTTDTANVLFDYIGY